MIGRGMARQGSEGRGRARQGAARKQMKTITVKLKSISPYSQSKSIDEKRLDRETGEDYELRTWRSRMHVDENGNVFIPPMVFKNCLSEAAKFLSIQIPGKGKATYTKHFEAGLLILDSVNLGIKAKDVAFEKLFVPADGRRGGPKRVHKYFPLIPSWEGSLTVHVLDQAITKDVFAKHFEEAGKFIGIGRFRPRNNGYYGRFEVVSISGF